MNLMRFFKRPNVCATCGVHYDVPTHDVRWGHLCPEHRKPIKELDLRKDAVLAWASHRWEKLEKQMKAELAAEAAKYQSDPAIQAALQSMAAQQSRNQYCSSGQSFNPWP